MSQSNRLPFELDDRIDDSLVTAHAGVPLVVELFRSSGGASVMDQAVSVKKRRRGLSPSEMAECFFALWSAGGDRCEDFKHLRADDALGVLLGHDLCASTTARDFLEGFHEEDLPLLFSGEKAEVRGESSSLGGLELVNRRLLAWSQAGSMERTATLDVDASIYGTAKRTTKKAYEGTYGYQPVTVVWAEKDLVVGDEFRDGNVPAHTGNKRVLERAVGNLPEGVETLYVRGDSALYEHDVLRYLDDEEIGYGISAVMTPELQAVVAAVPDDGWQDLGDENDAVRQWSEVEFFPADGDYRKVGPVARRYLALRVLKKQGGLFSDGSDRRHFAVVTNLDWAGDELLRWHRKKAGTIEHVHEVLKNGLSAGSFPSGKFGANAAWFRLNVLLYNLLSLLKREALPGEFWTAKPKRLRFLLLNTVGRVVRHARETLLRLSAGPVRDLYDLARIAIRRKRLCLAGV